MSRRSTMPIIVSALIVLLCGGAGVVWFLFGWTESRYFGTVEVKKRFLGRITEITRDWDGDGMIDYTSVFSWDEPFDPEISPNCGQRALWDLVDLNNDGRWDMKITPVEDYPCMRVFSIDSNFDGRVDLEIETLMNQFPRLFESVRSTTTPPLYTVPCNKPCPESPFVGDVVCYLPLSAVHEFWSRAFQNEYVNGYDRTMSELLAAGFLPFSPAHWPDDWKAVFQSRMESSQKASNAEELTRGEYWEEVWGAGVELPENLCPPYEIPQQQDPLPQDPGPQ